MSSRFKYKIIARSNGHAWMKAFNFICCATCGVVRRADDKNKPCRGAVRVGPRVAVIADHREGEQS